jgi:hypothetical protein
MLFLLIRLDDVRIKAFLIESVPLGVSASQTTYQTEGGASSRIASLIDMPKTSVSRHLKQVSQCAHQTPVVGCGFDVGGSPT